MDSDREYDGGEESTDDKMSVDSGDGDVSMAGSADARSPITGTDARSPIIGQSVKEGSVDGSTGSNKDKGGEEKKAAYLLMRLSMKDGESVAEKASDVHSGVAPTRENDGLGFGARRGLGLVFKGAEGGGRDVGSPAQEDEPSRKRLRAASA